MRAAYITRYGEPDVIDVGELPVPFLGPTDVLVQVEVVSANAVDTFVRSGAYRTATPFPFVIGRDLVGAVADAGPGAAHFRPGERVWSASLGHGGRQGSYADYAVVSADRLYRAPEDVGSPVLVAAVHPAATAWLALFRHGRLRAGETVFVGGGAGNVGSAAVALASSTGARVIASARPEDAVAVRAHGATEVLDYRDPNLVQRVFALAPGGVDVHFTTATRHDLAQATEMLRTGGRIVLATGLGANPPLPVGSLYTKDASIVGFAISNATIPDLRDAVAGVARLLEQRRWQPLIADTLTLEDAAEIHRRVEAGVRGRLVVRV